MKKVTNFNVRLKELLKENHLTKYKLSRELDIPGTTMIEYYSGKYIPKMKPLAKIANYFKVDYRWLLGYDVKKEAKTQTRRDADLKLDSLNDEELKTLIKIIDILFEY